MRLLTLLPALAVMLLAAAPASAQAPAAGAAPAAQTPPPPPLIMTTDAFPDGGVIPVQFSQAAPGAAPGEGTSPAIEWINVPEGTQSFVLHMHDIDVARQGTTNTQVHWLVWNLPADATGLPEGVQRGVMENGALQISVTGDVYRGPGASASGPLHHYVFELYAIDTVIDVAPVVDAADATRNDPFATRAAVMEAIEGHILGKSTFVGLFRRPPA
ncbi:MAG: YbhB/YbcL family Raf kinase inhibitor-like protein [Bauldia sp.]